jgi:integrase
MTRLRLGELVALRWRDVDWTAGRTRIRQNYVRGRYGTPKSRRSTRSVPMTDEVQRRARSPLAAVALAGRRPAQCSHTPRPASRWRRRTSPAACTRPWRTRGSMTTSSTTCATRSGLAWPPPGCRCAPSRSGWPQAHLHHPALRGRRAERP